MLRKKSPLPSAHKGFFHVVSTDEARELISRLQPVSSEVIPVAEGAGRVVARAMRSPIDLPHFDRAVMDGYAVRAADTFGSSESQPTYLRLTGTIEMGERPESELAAGCAMRIATGGMLPPGADAVVMVEYTEEVAGGLVEIRRGVAPWEHVQRVGEDVRRGTRLFARGQRLRPLDLGALTGVGFTRISVFTRPKVALICTGDELVPPDRRPRPGQVRNVNEYSLVAMAAAAGAQVTDLGIVRDRPEELRRALEQALSEHDAVLLSGGSSVGVKDMALQIIASFPRSRVLFHGISVAPGKPTLLALCDKKPVLGLPGHPQSALVIFALFGAPLIRVLGGEQAAAAFRWPAVIPAVLAEGIASQPGREDYVRVILEEKGNERMAYPLPGKSASIYNLVHADGLIRIPAQAEGIEAGAPVEVLLLH